MKTTATAARPSPPPRRSTRTAAGSLARFRYREDTDSDGDAGADAHADRSSDDDHKPAEGDDGSSLSGLSFHSDIEDAIVAPKRGRRRAAVAAGSAATGKRKRAATVTTTTTTVGTALPTRKKRNGSVTAAAAAAAAAHGSDGRGATRAIKDEEEDDDDGPGLASVPAAAAAAAAAATPRKTRRPARTITTKVEGPDGAGEAETHVAPPTDWEVMYDLVKAMRLTGPAQGAAVDTMGCERLAQASASARDRRFHTLVALMLSSQTKDTVNAVVMARLQRELPAHAPGAPAGLTLENMLAVDPAQLNQLIWQVGFHNNKTRYLKQAAVLLRDQWGGDIPPTAEGLMALPGVGPKMAYLCLAAENGWNRVEGIGVDVHVHRITNLWGWQKPGSAAAKTPEGTRLALQSWLPRDKWKEINWLLVGFGQTVCLPQGARCGDCTLGLRGLCRAANRKKVAEGRKKRQEMGLDAADGEEKKETMDVSDVKEVKEE